MAAPPEGSIRSMGVTLSVRFSVPRDFRAPGAYLSTIHGARVQAQSRMLVNYRHTTILIARGRRMAPC